MAIFEITLQCNQFFDYKVEANSKEEALKRIKDGYVNPTEVFTDYHTQTVHYMEEKN